MGGWVSRQTAWNWFESTMVMFANVAKSLAWMAFSMASIRPGTIRSRSCRSGEVCTVRCMPAVDDVPFFLSDTTQIRACISGQCDCGATSTASESVPLASVPSRQATKPPKSDRQAEPDPCRAMRDSSEGDCGSSYSAARDATRAARPDADEASPAAVGKLLYDAMRRKNVDSYFLSSTRRAAVSQTHLGQGFVLCLHLRSPCAQLLDAHPQTPLLLDLVLLSVQPQLVLSLERCVSARRRRGGEVVLRERDGEGGVGREDELGITLAPVSARSVKAHEARLQRGKLGAHLMTAMFTGAETVASYTMVVACSIVYQVCRVSMQDERWRSRGSMVRCRKQTRQTSKRKRK